MNCIQKTKLIGTIIVSHTATGPYSPNLLIIRVSHLGVVPYSQVVQFRLSVKQTATTCCNSGLRGLRDHQLINAILVKTLLIGRNLQVTNMLSSLVRTSVAKRLLSNKRWLARGAMSAKPRSR
jgi:hypothetical protein